MPSIPELLMQLGPSCHMALAIAAACLWLLAACRVLRDTGHSTALRARFVQPLAVELRRLVHHVRRRALPPPLPGRLSGTAVNSPFR